MSSHLEWTPLRSGNPIKQDVQLKHVLTEEYGSPLNMICDRELLPFLRGLQKGGCEGADELIKLIEKHDAIYVYEVF